MNYLATQVNRVGGTIEIDLEQINSYIEEKCGGIEYFLGCWSVENFPSSKIEHPDIQFESGDNWFVLRNGASKVPGLVFPGDGQEETALTVFRGYLGEHGIHSYADPDAVKQYWAQNPFRRHNGIFAAATISDDEKKLTFVTDIFGVSPIFVRRVGSHILFSNVAALLSAKDDKPDEMSWVMRLLLGSIPGSGSLVQSVEKLPPASVTSFDAYGVEQDYWYDLRNLPKADTPYSDLVLEQSHQYLGRAMQRCASIKFGENLLPLSAGYDSRRLFGHLERDKISFRTCTVQMPGKWGEDSDAVFGKKIADDYGIDHMLVEMGDKYEWHRNHIQRNNAFSGLADSHGWSVALFNKLNDFQGCFYDGLGGDVFVSDPMESDELTIEIKPLKPLGFLKNTFSPLFEDIGQNFNDQYMAELGSANNAIITYVLWQSRNMTAMWAQNQTRPGQITLCPYLDLEYIEQMMHFSGEGLGDSTVQKRVLEKFWTELAAYPNSHDRSDKVPSVREARREVDEYSYFEYLKYLNETPENGLDVKDVLSIKGRLILFLSRYVKKVRQNQLWWTQQLPHMVKWWHERPIVFKIDEDI